MTPSPLATRPAPSTPTPTPRPGADVGLYAFVALILIGMLAIGIAFSRL